MKMSLEYREIFPRRRLPSPLNGNPFAAGSSFWAAVQNILITFAIGTIGAIAGAAIGRIRLYHRRTPLQERQRDSFSSYSRVYSVDGAADRSGKMTIRHRDRINIIFDGCDYKSDSESSWMKRWRARSIADFNIFARVHRAAALRDFITFSGTDKQLLKSSRAHARARARE